MTDQSGIEPDPTDDGFEPDATDDGFEPDPTSDDVEIEQVDFETDEARVNALRAEDENRGNVLDAVDFIRDLRQSSDLSMLPVGRDVIVIGGGMTAVDAAVQARLLGAHNVTIVYRRGQDRMGASRHEQDHATSSGVRIICHAAPLRVHGNGTVREVEFMQMQDGPDGRLLRLTPR